MCCLLVRYDLSYFEQLKNRNQNQSEYDYSADNEIQVKDDGSKCCSKPGKKFQKSNGEKKQQQYCDAVQQTSDNLIFVILTYECVEFSNKDGVIVGHNNEITQSALINPSIMPKYAADENETLSVIILKSEYSGCQ